MGAGREGWSTAGSQLHFHSGCYKPHFSESPVKPGSAMENPKGGQEMQDRGVASPYQKLPPAAPSCGHSPRTWSTAQGPEVLLPRVPLADTTSSLTGGSSLLAMPISDAHIPLIVHPACSFNTCYIKQSLSHAGLAERVRATHRELQIQSRKALGRSTQVRGLLRWPLCLPINLDIPGTRELANLTRSPAL